MINFAFFSPVCILFHFFEYTFLSVTMLGWFSGKGKGKKNKKASSKGHTAPVPKKVKSNISSGEEEDAVINVKKRTKRTKKSRPAVKMESKEMTTDAPLVKVKIEGLPNIVDIKQMVADYPHLQTYEKTCVGAKESESAMDLSADTGIKRRKKKERDGKQSESRAASDATPSSLNENPLAMASQRRAIQRELDALPEVRPVLLGKEEWNSNDKLEMIKGEILHLPLMDAEFEQKELLHESGEWKHYSNGQKYTFPPCAKGAECHGMAGTIQMEDGKGVFRRILPALMFESEYKHFIKTGIAPAKRNWCVACWRKGITDTLLAVRGAELMVDGDEQQFKLSKDTLIQPYRQTTDRKGGYYSHCCMVSPDGKWEGLIGPIATWRASYLVGRVGPDGRHYVDQSAMMWKPGDTETIGMGETVRNFSTGVAL